MGDALGRVPIVSQSGQMAGRKKKLGDGDEICISMEKTEKVYSGQRIRKTENGVETNYFYDGEEVLYTEDGSGNINAFNVAGGSDNYTATIRYTEGLQYYTYNKDIKGSVSNLVDDSGNSVVSYEYSDFGITTIHRPLLYECPLL